MCFRWLHCNFQEVMVVHYDKLFKGAEKLTRHHWSMVELKYVFTGAAIARPVELQEFAVGSYSLFRALFLFPVSHWCCLRFGCRCDVTPQAKSNRTQPFLIIMGWVPQKPLKFSTHVGTVLFTKMHTAPEIKRCNTRGEDISKQSKTWGEDLLEKCQTKVQGKIWTILFLYTCSSMFGILIDCHWGKIHRALDNQDN